MEPCKYCHKPVDLNKDCVRDLPDGFNTLEYSHVQCFLAAHQQEYPTTPIFRELFAPS